ncbi:hypothetical protein TSOC_008722 [Tetrabaena socialis]|uniref:Sepiapterin reductase n=1 Tax=Tetrabaena socialis TaxID=47790 RepID=A0A2J7ZXR9_9CHLO|nr:hypothetical protein TSOC_008722 [Tetrabaena socialis]|eukprot:PNH05063.1 hypothetical protein TSOC_008722 [Tetrabaena socialis]
MLAARHVAPRCAPRLSPLTRDGLPPTAPSHAPTATRANGTSSTPAPAPTPTPLPTASPAAPATQPLTPSSSAPLTPPNGAATSPPLSAPAVAAAAALPAAAVGLPAAAPTPTAPRFLTILTGASRGLGAALARTLVQRGPPLPVAAAAAAAAAAGRRRADGGPPGGGGAGGSGGGSGGGGGDEAAAGGVAVQHDLVLLASDPGRLATFVRQGLEPLLREGPRDSRRAAAAAVTTRLLPACFDLGDLASLERNIARLLAPPDEASAAATGLSAAVPLHDSHGGGDAVAVGGPSPLPLPPGAYTHVLLIHNAGQVGDLLPLEQQRPDNIRTQVDLNITSFAQLTAAVLATFVHAPLLQPQQQQHHQQQQQQSPNARELSVSGRGSEAGGGTLAPQEPHSGAMAAAAAKAGPGWSRDGAGGSCIAGDDLAGDHPSTSARQGAGGPLAGGASASGSGSTSANEGGDGREATAESGASSSTGGSWGLPGRGGAQQQQRERQHQDEQQRRTVTIVNISSVSAQLPYGHFSLYGMGKAARHMLVRSIAHEAALRESEVEAAAAAAAPAPAAAPSPAEAGSSGGAASAYGAEAGAAGTTGPGLARPPPLARVRALSYAPGAIDTEMQAVAVVDASVSAVTVAGLLLWAEARGSAFAGLLSRLKAWYVDNHEAVMCEAKEEVRLLAARSLDLFFELVSELPSKRPRTM